MVTIKITTETPEMAAIIVQVLMEVERAMEKHPVWPTDNVKRAAIIIEEAGELVREANLLDEGKGSISNLKTECIQTAGTCLRMLHYLNEDQNKRIEFLCTENL